MSKIQQSYISRPLSLIVEEVSDMAILHDGVEMKGQVDVKMSIEKAQELLKILTNKIGVSEGKNIVLFTLKGVIK